MIRQPERRRRPSLGGIAIAALVAALLPQALSGPVLAANCPGSPGGRASKSQGDAHRAQAAVAARAAHVCSQTVPTPPQGPTPAQGPTPLPVLPPSGPPTIPSTIPPATMPPATGSGSGQLGPPAALSPVPVGGPVSVAGAGGAAALPGGSPLAGVNPGVPAARPAPGPAARGTANPSVAGPALASLPALFGVATRVAYVVRGWQAEMLIEVELLAAVLAILLIAVARRRSQRRITAELAATAGLPASALAGVPVGAAAALVGVVARLHERSERLSREALLDELTGVYRRGAGMDSLARDVARAERALVPHLAVAMVDVDGLKVVNDSAGHSAGDDLLRAVASALSGRIRGQDLVFRYGGDEFVCVFPNTEVGEGWRLLDQICSTLSEALGRRAFSFGVAQFRPGDSAEALLERADRALYTSRGRR